jgi:hypothetical protein
VVRIAILGRTVSDKLALCQLEGGSRQGPDIAQQFPEFILDLVEI